jgi:serine protease Do
MRLSKWILLAAGGGAVYYLGWLSAGEGKPAVVASGHEELRPISPSLDEFSRAFASAARRVAPSVVHVEVTRKVRVRGRQTDPFFDFFGDDFFEDFFGGRRHLPDRYFDQHGLGSGVIVSSDGLVVTNNHVVGEADQIKVKMADRREFEAELVGADRDTDIAVIRLKGKGDFPAAELGNSEILEVGQWVIAIGNPFGLDQTVTAGIVSAKGRDNVGVAAYEDFIQTDAAINPGNSGGPLIDLNGRVVGINTAIASKTGGYQGVGFAVPIDMARGVMEDLVAHGEVSRGGIGLVGKDLDPKMARQFGIERAGGVVVAEVVPGGPADRAGIRVYDVMLRFGKTDLKDFDHLRKVVAGTQIGSKQEVLIWREGKEITVTVEVEDRAETLGASDGHPAKPGEATEREERLGLLLEPLNPDEARRMRVERGGLLVREVDPNGMAVQAGIRPGAVILEVNRRSISSLKQFRQELQEGEEGALLLYHQDGYTQLAFVAW